MDLSEEAAEGKTPVAGESVAHAAGGGHDAGGGEEHAHEGEDQQACRTGLAVGGVEEDLQERARSGRDDSVDILENEEKAGQEDETGEHANEDAEDHDPGAFALRVRNLLDHVDGGVESGKGEGTLEKAEEPSESIGPSRRVDKIAVDKRAALVVTVGASQHGDADDGETGEGPEEGGLGEIGEQAVHERIDQESDDRVSNVDEELVPGLRDIVVVEQGDDSNNQLAAEQSSGGCQAHPSSHVNPARSEADERTPFLPADDGSPVILSTRGWVRRDELGERESQRQVAEASDDETPNHGAGTTRRERETQTRGKGSPAVENSKRKPQHGDQREVSGEFLLHTEPGKCRSIVAIALMPCA